MYILNILISMTSPYLLADALRVKTSINCFTNAEIAVDALIEKLTGESEFTGKDPVDAFCGLEDMKLNVLIQKVYEKYHCIYVDIHSCIKTR